MSAFGDTSGFLAFLDPEDNHHEDALGAMEILRERGQPLHTSNYVVLEAVSILHHRSGIAAVRRLHEALTAFKIEWIDEPIHSAGLSAVLASGRRGPSLVDCTSFELMRRLGISEAFAFDRHFTEAGITRVRAGQHDQTP